MLISPLYCPMCGSRYNDELNKPCKGLCEHSICLPCRNEMPTKKCQICHRDDAFAELRIDYTAIEILKKFQEPMEEPQKQEVALCSECREESFIGKLRICVTCNSSNISHADVDSCHLHLKKGVGRESVKAICSWCAIDNHLDIGHFIAKLKDVKELEPRIKRKSEDRESSYPKRMALETIMI